MEETLSGNDFYAFAWRNVPWFKENGLSGHLAFWLNSYLSRTAGGREFLPLYSEEDLKLTFPDDLFDAIESKISNPDRSLWTLAAFREESHFRSDSVSSSGASGIAQLMPGTASAIRANAKHPEWNLYDSLDNLEMGILHYRFLFQKYKGNVYYALAAYNAGEPAVNRWIKQYRYSDDLWLECLDYAETRDYIKKIALSRFMYKRIYSRFY